MEKSLTQKRPSLYNLTSQLLLWDQPFSNLIQLIFFICSNLHCAVILIAFQLEFIATSGHDTLSYFLKKFCKILSLMDVASFQAHQDSIYFVIVIVIIYMVIFLTTFVYSLGKYWKRGEFTRGKIAFCILYGQFHLACGFWVINALLMDYVNRGNVDSETGIVAVIGILIILNYSMAFFVAISSYDPFLSSNLLSCHSPIFQILIVLFKGIATPIIFLAENSAGSNWSFIVIALVIFIGMVFNLTSTFPYYRLQAMKIALVSSTVSLLFAFLGFLSLTNASKHFQYFKVLVYIEFMMIPLVSTLSFSWLNGITSSYLSVVHKDIKTKRDVMKKLFVLRFMIEKAQRKSKEEDEQATRDLRFYGTYKKKISGGSSVAEKNKITEVKEIMREFLEEMTQKFPHSQLLKTLLIDVSLDNTKLALEVMMFSLMELAKIQGRTKLITLKLSQRLQKKVSYFFENNKHKILDLNQFLEHDNITNKIDNAIQRHIKNYISFWSAYLKPNIQIRDFYLQSKELEKNAAYIENIWKQRVEPDRLLAGSLYQLYVMYLFLLRASPFRGQIVSKKYVQYYREKAVHHDGLMGNTEFTNEDLTDLNVFTIHASIMKESPGKILEVSANFKQTTGWNKNDAVGRNVNLLLPRWIAKSHYKFLMEHLKRLNSGGMSDRMYKTIPTYFQHHDGYIIPCDIYLSLHPIVQETPVYIVFVRLNTAANGEKLLISKDGNIEGFTEGIGNFLNLSHNTKTTIENVCGDASEIRDAIQRLEKNPEEEEYMIRPFTVDFVSLKVNNMARIGLPCTVSVRPYLFDGEVYYFLSVTQKVSKTGEENRKVFFSQVDNEEEDGLAVERFASELIEDDNLDELADQNGVGMRVVSLASSVPIFSYRSEKLITGAEKQEYKDNTTQIDSPSKRKIGGETQENVYSYGDVQSGTFLVSTNRNLLFDRKSGKAKEKTLLLKKKKSQIQDKLFEASSSIGSNKKQAMTKFERSLVNIPKNPQLKWTYLLFIALMAVAALALVLFQVKNDSILDQVHGSEETISNTIFRLTRYTDVYAYSRIISQAVDGITDPYKFAPYGYTISTVDFSVLQLQQVLKDVRDTNAAIQNFIPKLDSSLVNEIYGDLVPVYETMADGSIVVTRKDNLFDLSIELVAWGLRFLNSGLPLNLENPYVDFLLNNTMNDPLLANEREVPLMVNNNDIQLNHLSTFLYVVIAITCLFAVCIFGFFVRIVKAFQRERNQLILVFTNIYDKHISDHLAQLENFQSILIKTKEKTYKSHTQILASLPSKRNHNSSSSSNRPKVDTRGVNRVLYILYLALACFLFAICSPFPIIIGTFKESSKTILNKLDLMTQSNLNLYNLVYYWNTLYAYCEPGVVDWEYVKNKPLAEGVLDAYAAVLNVQDFIVNTLLNPENGLADNQALKNTVVGNLCELYKSSDELVTGFCPTLGGGAATKGVLGLHTYYVVGLHAVQQCYNYSSRTFADSQKCLSLTSIVDTEVIYPVLYWAYQNMDSIINPLQTEYINIDISEISIFFLLLQEQNKEPQRKLLCKNPF